jgi:hypothetical protein
MWRKWEAQLKEKVDVNIGKKCIQNSQSKVIQECEVLLNVEFKNLLDL